jgi:pyruvate/2-oxoglutarate/acetoin dehydrogenase E1 component
MTSYLESLRNSLHEVMQRDHSVVVLGEDILDPYGGAFKVTKGLATAFPDRVLTTPICEATITGIAVGLALRGLKPVAEIMFGDFVTLATDQIVNHATKYYAMYNREVDMPIVIRTPMGGGRAYGPTHSQSLEKLFFGVPYLKIVAPSHFHDAGEMLANAINDTVPVLFIENKLLYPLKLFLHTSENIIRRKIKSDDGYSTVIIQNYGEHQKPDIALIAYGGLSRIIEPLMVKLKSEEIRVITCFPGELNQNFDEILFDIVRKSGRVVVIEEASADFGWGAEIAARIYSELFNQLKCPIIRVGALSSVIPASKSLEDRVLVSEDKIQQSILEALNYGISPYQVATV